MQIIFRIYLYITTCNSSDVKNGRWWFVERQQFQNYTIIICYPWYLHLYCYHWVESSAGWLLFRPVVSASTHAWFHSYTYYWNLQFLSNTILIKLRFSSLRHNSPFLAVLFRPFAFIAPKLIWFCNLSILSVIPERRRAH